MYDGGRGSIRESTNMFSDLCEEDSTFLEGITQLLQDRRRKINTTFEEDKNTLHALQAQNETLRKENNRLIKENGVLREEISFLQLSSKEKDEKLCQMEARKEFLKKEASFAEQKWTKLIETMNKKCTCGRGKMEKAAQGLGTPNNLSPAVKIKNVSNVFFMSPVKAKANGEADVELAPLSEDYLTEHVNASTPVIVADRKKSLGVHFESNRSDSEEEIGSPSLFSDHEIKYETPAASKKLIKLRGRKGKDTPGTEVSAVLFSDKSLADDHGNKTSDVSDELNVHFNRLSANVSTDGNEDPDVVEVNKGGICLENNKENDCFQEPDLPIVKKRKCTPTEENDKHGRKSPVLGRNGLKVDSSCSGKDKSWKNYSSLRERNNVRKNNSSGSSHEASSLRQNLLPCSKTDVKLRQTLINGNNSKIHSYNDIKSSKIKLVDPDDNHTTATATATATANLCSSSSPLTNNSNKQSTAPLNPSTSAAVTTNPHNSHPTFKHHSVVRKKDERAKLPGFACEECRRYYESDNLSAERLAEVLKNCSRHKHVSAPPPSTPPQFWSLELPPTQECIDKGYMLDENQQLPTYVKPKFKRKKKKKDVNAQ